MRNRTINYLLTMSFVFAIIVSTFLMFFPLINYGDGVAWVQELKRNSGNISSWILTVVFGVLSVKLKRPVLKCEQYCFDRYFIDRIADRDLLFSFLSLDNDDDRSLFIVKGGMCRGKTALLQRFADDVNTFGDMKLSKRQVKVCKKYCAYYLTIDSSAEDILLEIGKSLSKSGNLDTVEKVMLFLKKASYKKQTVLLIDNISRMQSFRAKQTAQQLLYKNPYLKIVLSITEESAEEHFIASSFEKQQTLTPSLFGEMHINELAKAFHRGISDKTNREIIRISNGIPSYVIMIFRAGILDKPTTLSNFEDMQNVVQIQLSRLGEDYRIAGYLACLKLCYDGPVSKSELLALASISEQHLNKVFDAALAEEKVINQQSFVFMNELVAKCCLKTLLRNDYLPMIQSFYEVRNAEISLVASILQSESLDTDKTMAALKEKYDQGKFLVFAKLGTLDAEGMLLAFRSNVQLYNFYRFYYLNSLLQLGEYSLAISTLEKYEKSDIQLPTLQQAYKESGFDFQYLMIDLHHLSNQFYEALEEINALLLYEEKLPVEKRYKLWYLKAHCLKHLGTRLKEADSILLNMESKKLCRNLAVKVLYSRLAIHMFWGDAKFDYDSIMHQLELMIQNETPEWAHAQRHKAHYAWMQTGSAAKALSLIDAGLEVLERTRWRIIYDFYFEKAEWMRIQNEEEGKIVYKTENILSYYDRALEFATENGDINLACCAYLGRILVCLHDKKASFDWKNEQLEKINVEFKKADNAGLEINKAYIQRIKFLLMDEEPSEEFIRHCEVNRFSNLILNMSGKQNLKLTVM